jgi:hypothetical protein
MGFPRALARLRRSVARVRIKSRFTSANPPSIKRPVLVSLLAHGSAKDRNCALGSTMRVTMPKQVEGTGCQPVDARHRHHVAEGQLAEHPVKLASVGPRTRFEVSFDRNL